LRRCALVVFRRYEDVKQLTGWSDPRQWHCQKQRWIARICTAKVFTNGSDDGDGDDAVAASAGFVVAREKVLDGGSAGRRVAGR